jgi:DNA polymerase
LEENNFPIVFHAHDEVVAEIPTDNTNALHDVERLMTVLPAWADGLPLAAEGWRGKRYRK